jgi:NitT/TauT family transport system substrate-binding protein
MKKTFRIALCALAALAGTARAEDVVRLGNQKFVIYGAVAYMKQLAPKYGLRIEERVYDKGIDMIPALNAGELDIAASAADAAVVARAGGAKTYVVAGFAKGSARLLSRADLGMKKIAELKGKRVGVARGGVVELLLAAELSKHGLTWSDRPGRDVTVVYMPYGELNAGLESKKVDAILQSEPYAAQAIHKGVGKEMLKPYDTELGEPVRVLVMTEAMYQQKPEVALRVMKCFVEATRAFKKDRKLAEKFIREELFKGQLTAEGFRDAIENAEFTYDVSPHHVQVTTDLMLKYGIGRMVTPPAATDWVKLDLLEKAKG